MTLGGISLGLVLCLAVTDLASGKTKENLTSTSAETKPIMNQEITNLLKAYEKALNTSDTKAAMALYGSDPIFVAQNAVAFIGRDAVQASYQHIFEALKLNVVHPRNR